MCFSQTHTAVNSDEGLHAMQSVTKFHRVYVMYEFSHQGSTANLNYLSSCTCTLQLVLGWSQGFDTMSLVVRPFFAAVHCAQHVSMHSAAPVSRVV